MRNWLSDKQLDSIILSDKQIFVLLKLYKRNYQNRLFIKEDLRRLGTSTRTINSLVARKFARYIMKDDGWKITAIGKQLAETYDDRLIDL